MRSLFGTPPEEKAQEQPKPEEAKKQDPKEQGEVTAADLAATKKVKASRTKGRHFTKRILSELNLEQVLPWHFEKGAAYHCISWGDVDSLTYLRVIVKQQRLEYVVLSTWCMAITDVKEVEKWLERGDVGRIDFYVGEIFQASYFEVYLALKELVDRYGARVCVFRNHAKVMAGFGDDFDFVIEGSANVNTNPRTEQTCITIDTELAYFYKEFFDDVNSFNQDFENWKPYILKRDRHGTI